MRESEKMGGPNDHSDAGQPLFTLPAFSSGPSGRTPFHFLSRRGILTTARPADTITPSTKTTRRRGTGRCASGGPSALRASPRAGRGATPCPTPTTG